MMWAPERWASGGPRTSTSTSWLSTRLGWLAISSCVSKVKMVKSHLSVYSNTFTALLNLLSEIEFPRNFPLPQSNRRPAQTRRNLAGKDLEPGRLVPPRAWNGCLPPDGPRWCLPPDGPRCRVLEE
jgi:hypothetical protein